MGDCVMVFESLGKHGDHEEVIFCYDKTAGLKAIIAVHNTTLGPALGGTRMWPYAKEEDALVDVLRLSKGMTYKAACAGLNLGGGKAVIIGDPKKDKSELLFRAFGQYVNSLNGRYITAEDIGTDVRDMGYVYAETPWVTGVSKALGGGGDPSPLTANGVWHGIKAATKEKLGTTSLKGMRVVVQGTGKVGYYLIELLKKEGAIITIADIDQERVKKVAEEFGAKVANPDTVLFEECDVLAPCAMGAIFNDQTIPKLKTKIVAGGANNVLAEARHGAMLKELGVLYAPDYVINAGGLMNVFVELEGYSQQRALEKTESIFENLSQVFALAKKENIPTNQAADMLAEHRIAGIGKLRQKHTGRAQRLFTTLKVDNR